MLLFDRSSRQARLTAAGEELLAEGRRLLAQMDAVAHRVKRVASGWETAAHGGRRWRDFAHHGVRTVRGLLRPQPARRARRPGCACAAKCWRARWEALTSGQADLSIGMRGRVGAAGRHSLAAAGRDGVRLRRRAASPARRGDRAAQRRRAAAPPGRRGGRLGAADDADHGQPAARPGRADRGQRAGQDRGPPARPGLRLPAPSRWCASTSAPGCWSCARCSGAARSGTPGLRLAQPADRRRASGPARPGAALVAAAAREPGDAHRRCSSAMPG